MLQNRGRGDFRRISKSKAIVLLLTLFSCQRSPADKLISCNDGDTCRFSRGSKILKVRLAGIDAPEGDQPFGSESRQFLVKLLENKEVKLSCHGKSDDRITCGVFVNDLDIQKEMVRSGWALDSPRYSGGKYEADQKHAQNNKYGIWKKTDNFSPYCWRWLGTPECNKNKLYQE